MAALCTPAYARADLPAIGADVGKAIAPQASQDKPAPDPEAAAPQDQEQPSQDQDQDQAQSGEIVVTGSRIARTTFETPTPVTSIGEAQLEAKAPTNVTDLLRDVPALRPNGRGAGGGRNQGLSTFNMRSLGSTRTLLLLDGQRVLDSSPVAGGFDINIIPAPLVSRLEIVTAGASSVYGSDAITGVVNVILNDKFEGAKIDAQYNVSTHGDLGQVVVSGIFGTKFGGGRGRVMIAGSYSNMPDILYQGARDWGSQGYTLVPNAAYTPTNGQYRQLILPNQRYSSMTAGGVITTAGALQNIQFGENGAQSIFHRGTNFGGVWMTGGDGEMPQPSLGIIQVAQKQYSGFGRISYDLTDDVTVRADVLVARTEANSTNNYNYNNGDITIRRDNPYLPANILQLMIDNGLQTVRLGRYNPETGINTNSTVNDYYRYGLKVNGSFSPVWTWEIGGSYTYAKSTNLGRNNRNNINWNKAIDPVMGPNGPICRSTLTNPNDGCVPANVFGIGSLTPEVVAYVTGTSSQVSKSYSAMANVNVSGELFNTWAGPVKIAIGGDYRKDVVNNVSDPISDISGWRQGTFGSYRGRLEVKEGYSELSIPLAKNASFAKSLDLDLAGRVVQYSTVGSTSVWKIGGNWAINDSIRLRSTYSKDFRAPKINDLFSQANLRAGNTVIDFRTNASVNVNLLQGGNPDLKPETAHTFTAGVVLEPSFIPRLQFSADYFNINLKDALITPGAQEVVDRCGRGDATFCAGIIRDSLGNITQVNAVAFNAQTLKTSGIDFELNYRIPVGDGDIGLRAVATYTQKLVASTLAGNVDTAGQVNGDLATPHWRGSATLSYDQGPFNFRMLFNVIGSGKYDNTYGPLDISRNNYPAYVYTDISMQYQVTDALQFYAKVENLLDTDPPLIANNTITIAAAASSQFYDQRGRVAGIGARLKF